MTAFIVGWRGGETDIDKALEELPVPPERMNWLRVLLPFAVFGFLVFIGRRWPHSTPILGLPFMFLVAAACERLRGNDDRAIRLFIRLPGD